MFDLTRKRSFANLVIFGLMVTIWMPAPALAAETPNPYAKADESWITLKGTVKSSGVNSFVLDYGEGEIIVEMDDGDLLGDAYKVMPGDEIQVSGRIDDDFFESTSIEASAVHVKSINATFLVSPQDEETPGTIDRLSFAQPLIGSEYHLVGTVSKIAEDGFFVDVGTRSVQVGLDQMHENLLDDEGFMKIEKGDRVAVSGMLDEDLFEGREVAAVSVVKLMEPGS